MKTKCYKCVDEECVEVLNNYCLSYFNKLGQHITVSDCEKVLFILLSQLCLGMIIYDSVCYQKDVTTIAKTNQEILQS